jgi:hypothetical protein
VWRKELFNGGSVLGGGEVLERPLNNGTIIQRVTVLGPYVYLRQALARLLSGLPLKA